MTEQPRQGAGTHTGGRWVATPHSEGDVDLGPISDIQEALEKAGTVSPEELWVYVRHPSPDVRCEAASNPRITAEQLTQLARDPDLMTRHEVARLPYPGVAEVMSQDANPIVRHEALTNGWDLSEATRRRLENDDGVTRVRAALRTGEPPSTGVSAHVPA